MKKAQATKKENLERECAFCEGQGKDPFGIPSPESTCQVCGGRGKITPKGELKACRYCNKTGKHLVERLTCPVCRGHGVFQFDGKGQECSQCAGAGKSAGRA